jgi:hypothetical protein
MKDKKRKNKYAYLAHLSNKENNSYYNHRYLFVCNCSYKKEYSFGDIKDIRNSNDKNIVCECCGKSHNIIKDVIILSSKLYYNQFDFKLLFFEDEKFITLKSYSKYIGLNINSKNIYDTQIEHSIKFNKETKRFFLINKKNKSNPIKNLNIFNIQDVYEFVRGNLVNQHVGEHGHLESYCSFHRLDYVLESSDIPNIPKIIKDVDKYYFNPLKKFTESFRKFIYDSDFNFLNNYPLNKEEFFISTISLVQFPNYSSLIKMKGFTFLKDMIHHTNVTYSFLKKYKATSPRKIVSKSIHSRFLSIVKSTLMEKNYQTDEFKNISKRSKKFIVPNIILKSCKNFKDVYVYYNLYLLDIFNEKKLINYYSNQDDLKILSSFSSTFRIYCEDINAIVNKENLFISKLINSGFSAEKIFNHYKKVYKKDIKKQVFGFFNHTYVDTLRMMKERGEDLSNFFKLDTPSKIRQKHDGLHSLIRFEEMEKFNKKIKINSLNYFDISIFSYKDIEFSLIDSSRKLDKESSEMKHCVASYADRIADNTSIIYSIEDKKTKERATLEFYVIENKKLYFSQMFGVRNSYPSEKINNSYNFLTKFLKEKGYNVVSNRQELKKHNELLLDNTIQNLEDYNEPHFLNDDLPF